MSEFQEERLLEERKTGIGGSDVAAVMSEAPWGCARRLFYAKCDVPPDYPVSETAERFMRRGQRLEAIAAEEYQHLTKRSLRRTGVKRDPAASHHLVHIDRMQVNVADPPPDQKATTAPLELKVPGERAFERVVQEGLPPAYVLQSQWGMGITGYPWASFGILHADSWRMLTFDVAANPGLIRALEDAVDRFWDALQRGEEPPRLEPGDERCERCPYRRRCWGDRVVEILNMAAARKAEGKGELVPAPELAPVLDDYLEAKRILAEHEEMVDTIGKALREQIGERQGVLVAGHVVRFTLPKPSVSLDMDAMRIAMPAAEFETLMRNYGKPRKQSRTLRIY